MHHPVTILHTAYPPIVASQIPKLMLNLSSKCNFVQYQQERKSVHQVHPVLSGHVCKSTSCKIEAVKLSKSVKTDDSESCRMNLLAATSSATYERSLWSQTLQIMYVKSRMLRAKACQARSDQCNTCG